MAVAMRVGYLVTYYPRVSHTFIRREIAALEAQGVEVERFALRRAPDDVVDDIDLREAERTRVVLDSGAPALAAQLARTLLLRPLRFASALRLALRLGRASDRGVLKHLAYLVEACLLRVWFEQSGCSHVHVHFGTNSTAAAMLCHELGGPGYSFTAHGPDEFDAAYGLGLRDKIARARFVVAISSFGRSQLWRHCDYAHWSKVHVVHCGLDRAYLDAEPTPLPDRPRFVSVGRLSAQKGYPLLIEACAQLAAHGRDFELTLVGDGELRAELEALIDRHDLRARVRITGLADGARVREELRAARVFVLPSFAEGLPVVIMEALALGRPVLATSVAGVPELVSAECGWLVPAGSVDALVQAMERALATPLAELERMGQVGRARVRQQHDVQVEAEKLRALFERDAR
jgi:glycosyltransferase involved in cell wall biosynthesis